MMIVSPLAYCSPRVLRHALFGLVLLGAGACGEHEWRLHDRARNEMLASTALKMLTSAEADFRFNDRDRNGVNDFWTADVAGLYYVQALGQPIALIPKEIADADASPIRASDKDPVPYHGYYFAALVSDESTSPRSLYRQETDGKTGKIHNLARFGFCAFPADPGVSGRYVIIVNENNSLFWYHDWTGAPPTRWPDDNELKRRLWRHCRLLRRPSEAGEFVLCGPGLPKSRS